MADLPPEEYQRELERVRKQPAPPVPHVSRGTPLADAVSYALALAVGLTVLAGLVLFVRWVWRW